MHTRIRIHLINERIFKTHTKNQNRIRIRARLLHHEVCKIGLKLGLGGRAVLRLSETCLQGKNMYFDRYFIGPVLLESLAKRGISGTDTVVTTRFPNIELKSNSELLKEGKGAWDVRVSKDKSMLMLKWADNKPVVIATTAHGIKPTTKVKRYCRSIKTYNRIKQH